MPSFFAVQNNTNCSKFIRFVASLLIFDTDSHHGKATNQNPLEGIEPSKQPTKRNFA